MMFSTSYERNASGTLGALCENGGVVALSCLNVTRLFWPSLKCHFAEFTTDEL